MKIKTGNNDLKIQVVGSIKNDRAKLDLSWYSIIDLTQRLYQYCYAIKALKGYNGNANLIGIIANLGLKVSSKILNIVIRIKKDSKLSSESRREPNLIVSFTSFPDRIKYIKLVVDSIVRQIVLPSKVVLYLSREQFPNEESDLPTSIIEMISDFFVIKWVDEDLKPHKKYFYAFHDFPDCNIITIDDDSYYQRDMISRLINMHHHHPNSICANWIHNIVAEDKRIMPYRYWGRNFIYSDKPSFAYLAVGIGGILYPAHIFDNSKLFDKQKICELALTTDDLWLKAHELLLKIPIVTSKFYASPIYIGGKKDVTLTSKNVDSKSDKSQNDINWEKLDVEYGLSIIYKELLCE